MSVPPSSAAERVKGFRLFSISIGVGAAFLSRRKSEGVQAVFNKHWCWYSLPQQESLPGSIGVGAAFLSRRASKEALVLVQPSSAGEPPRKHWCRCSFPQQESFQNCNNGLEEVLLGRVAFESAIVVVSILVRVIV